MTNTTRTLTFRDEDDKPHHTVSTTPPTYRADSGMVVAIQMHGDAFPTIEYDREQLVELVEFARDALATPHPRDGVVDSEIMCGARIEHPAIKVECCLVDGHDPVNPGGPHITRGGTRFTTDLPF